MLSEGQESFQHQDSAPSRTSSSRGKKRNGKDASRVEPYALGSNRQLVAQTTTWPLWPFMSCLCHIWLGQVQDGRNETMARAWMGQGAHLHPSGTHDRLAVAAGKAQTQGSHQALHECVLRFSPCFKLSKSDGNRHLMIMCAAR